MEVKVEAFIRWGFWGEEDNQRLCVEDHGQGRQDGLHILPMKETIS